MTREDPAEHTIRETPIQRRGALEWLEDGVRLKWRELGFERLTTTGWLLFAWSVVSFFLLAVLRVGGVPAVSSVLVPMFLWCTAAFVSTLIYAFWRWFRVYVWVLSVERGVLHLRDGSSVQRVNLAEVCEVEQLRGRLELRLRAGGIRRLPLPALGEETQRFLEAVRAQMGLAAELHGEAASEQALAQLRRLGERER